MIRALVLLVLSVTAAVAQSTFPSPQGRVNDFANVLPDASEQALRDRIAELEKTTAAELAVVTVPSLDGMAVEEYATKLFSAWGIGKAREDNGVLLLVAPTDKKMRIEVGYGLEGVLPDGLAGQVIREQLTPRFRENDYAGGIRDGVDRLIEIVTKRQTLTPEEIARLQDDSAAGEQAEGGAVVLLGVFALIGGLVLGASLRARVLSQGAFGAVFAGFPTAIAWAVHPMGWLLVPLAVASAWVAYRWGHAIKLSGGTSTSGSGRRRGRRSDSDDSRWKWSSGSDSDSDSSSSSNRFGGGSSGGGGASGSW